MASTPSTPIVAPASPSNSILRRSALVASLGGLLFGFDTAVIAGATRALEGEYSLSPAALGFTVSSALWGTVLGSLFAGAPSDRYGRRICLRVLAVFYVASALGCAFAWNWYSFLFFRALGGLAIGGSSVISPTYIAEISPPARRGRLVGMFQFNVVFGILLAYVSNYGVGRFQLGAADWRWKLGVAAVPALLFLVALFTIPESPRWLATKGRFPEALEVIRLTGEPEPERELAEIRASLGTTGESPREALFQWKYRLPIYLAISIGLFNQLSGINAILYYLNDIFERAGFDRLSSDLQAVIIGVTNLMAVTCAMAMIDRIGRRQLLLIGSVGCAICLAGVGAIFATRTYQSALVWFLVGFIGFFSFSQGAVIWVYISEIFPNRVRAKGQSLGSFTHWFMNAIVSGLFPVLAHSWGALPFFFFAAVMAVQFFVVWLTFPETRGVSLEAMEKKLQIG
ncbi:MAG: sugar porter family MFS transporter [Acidobacteriota bacterium]|nr:sugar porter family MFS transporter [Acidobacteriota bacterium]